VSGWRPRRAASALTAWTKSLTRGSFLPLMNNVGGADAQPAPLLDLGGELFPAPGLVKHARGGRSPAPPRRPGSPRPPAWAAGAAWRMPCRGSARSRRRSAPGRRWRPGELTGAGVQRVSELPVALLVERVVLEVEADQASGLGMKPVKARRSSDKTGTGSRRTDDADGAWAGPLGRARRARSAGSGRSRTPSRPVIQVLLQKLGVVQDLLESPGSAQLARARRGYGLAARGIAGVSPRAFAAPGSDSIAWGSITGRGVVWSRASPPGAHRAGPPGRFSRGRRRPGRRADRERESHAEERHPPNASRPSRIFSVCHKTGADRRAGSSSTRRAAFTR